MGDDVGREGESQRDGDWEVVCVDVRGIYHVYQRGRIVKRYTADSFADVWARLEADQTSGRI